MLIKLYSKCKVGMLIKLYSKCKVGMLIKLCVQGRSFYLLSIFCLFCHLYSYVCVFIASCALCSSIGVVICKSMAYLFFQFDYHM